MILLNRKKRSKELENVVVKLKRQEVARSRKVRISKYGWMKGGPCRGSLKEVLGRPAWAKTTCINHLYKSPSDLQASDKKWLEAER